MHTNYNPLAQHYLLQSIPSCQLESRIDSPVDGIKLNPFLADLIA